MIITAKDLAKREGHRSVKERIVKLSRGTYNGKLCDTPVQARLDFGRWIADCECGGAEYVDPEEPIFFCASCLNTQYKGAARPVLFPTEYKRIEKIVEERPVIEGQGRDDVDKSLRAKSVVPGLSRSWNLDESLEDLQIQNIAGLASMKGMKHGI